MGNDGSGIIAGPFTLRSRDRAFRRLFTEATKRPPEGTPKITTVRSALLSRRATKTMVGLTRYSRIRYFFFSRPRQSMTFFLPLLSALSEPAVMAVIAHELAHAWLNEHVRPEESSQREHEADSLAREWGFGRELDALDQEADTVNAG